MGPFQDQSVPSSIASKIWRAKSVNQSNAFTKKNLILLTDRLPGATKLLQKMVSNQKFQHYKEMEGNMLINKLIYLFDIYLFISKIFIPRRILGSRLKHKNNLSKTAISTHLFNINKKLNIFS